MPNFPKEQIKTYASYRQDPLSLVIKNSQYEEVEKYLKNLPDINEPEGGIFPIFEEEEYEYGLDEANTRPTCTYLMQACQSSGVNTPNIVKLLLKAGADKDQQNEEGETALCVAISQNNRVVFDILLESGAKTLLPGVNPTQAWETLHRVWPSNAEHFETKLAQHCQTYQEHMWLYSYLSETYPHHPLNSRLKANLKVFEEQELLSTSLPEGRKNKKDKLKI